MARMLGRSRSLRILRGGHKESHQQDKSPSTPPPTNPQVDIERLTASTPVTCADNRVETADMLQRPKTSGGPADRQRQFHKKTTPVALDSSEDQNLKFPFPSPTKSATTLLYTAEINESREGVIGIALGSPTMASHWNSPHSTDFVTNYSGTVTQISSNPPLPEPVEVKQESQRPKLSRWKSIFKKTQPPPPQEQKQTFYQLAQSVVPPRADSHHDNESLESSTTTPLEEFKEQPSPISPPTFRPEIRESRKVPKGQIQPAIETRPRALTLATIAANQASRNRSTIIRSSSSPQPPAKDDSPTVPQLIISEGPQDPSAKLYASPTSLTDKPLLDVNIPDIKMERYSVMFGNLLQSNPNSSTSSSLLMRRQGTGERLKPLNELSVKKNETSSHSDGLKPQRRATSPSLAPKSPAVTLSLFPQPTNNSRAPSPHASSTNRIGRLQRSKTAPSVSPSRPSFSIPPSSDDVTKDLIQDSQVSKKPQAQKPEERIQEALAPEKDPNSTSQLLSASSTSNTNNSYDSESEQFTVSRAKSGAPWKASMVSPSEPEWEIVSKPTRKPSYKEMREALSSHPANTTVEVPKQPASAPLESSLKALNSKPQTPQTADSVTSAPRSADRYIGMKSPIQVQGSPRAQHPRNETQAATTVGVARSISVSRASPRSADLLRPIVMKRTDSSERLVERTVLTPTLVELKNRKSQRVQLVEA